MTPDNLPWKDVRGSSTPPRMPQEVKTAPAESQEPLGAVSDLLGPPMRWRHYGLPWERTTFCGLDKSGFIPTTNPAPPARMCPDCVDEWKRRGYHGY